MKPIIGIMGGISSGKSTVAGLFEKQGCKVINADQLALELLENKDIIDRLKGEFSEGILLPNGGIDRKKLAEKAFCSSQSVEAINAIIHPPILEKVECLLRGYMADSSVSGVVLDIPLLAESGWDNRCTALIFVDRDMQYRIKSANAKGKLSGEDIKKREKFQISLDKKKQIAHYVVQNNSDLSKLAEQAAWIFSEIMTKAAQ